MPDTDISFVDESLTMLLKAGKDFPDSNLDFSIAYISVVGVSLLAPLLKSTGRKRAVVGLAPINRANAFLRLQDMGVEVSVYVTESRRIFHPKIYYGTTNAQSWAMIGSSNLTQNGLSLNIERNLFIMGQRHAEPFSSIESQLDSFRTQAYPFNDDIKRIVEKIEKLPRLTENEYLQELVRAGIKPKRITANVANIPLEVQQVALEALLDLTKTSRLEYSYQMLLLLVMLSQTGNNGIFSIEDTAVRFSRFYELRVKAGLPVEKFYHSRKAEVEDNWQNINRLKYLIKINPFPRFERRGLLDLSEDTNYFIVNPALLTIMIPTLKSNLRSVAIDKLAAHYADDRQKIEEMVTIAIDK